MNLQADRSFGEFRRGIDEIGDFYSVETRDHAIPSRRDFQFVPIPGLQRLFAFWRRHHHPPPPAAFVEPACMFVWIWIHFYLHALDIRAGLWIRSGNFRVQKHATVAVCFALEFQTQIEITIGFLGCKVAVLVCGTLAQNRSVFGHPAFLAIHFPTRQIFAVEQ